MGAAVTTGGGTLCNSVSGGGISCGGAVGDTGSTGGAFNSDTIGGVA